jgi:hypothetical protein
MAEDVPAGGEGLAGEGVGACPVEQPPTSGSGSGPGSCSNFELLGVSPFQRDNGDSSSFLSAAVKAVDEELVEVERLISLYSRERELLRLVREQILNGERGRPLAHDPAGFNPAPAGPRATSLRSVTEIKPPHGVNITCIAVVSARHRGRSANGRSKSSSMGILYTLAAGLSDGRIAIYDSAGEQALIFDAAHGGGAVTSLSFEERAKSLLVATGSDGSAQIYSVGLWIHGKNVGGIGTFASVADRGAETKSGLSVAVRLLGSLTAGRNGAPVTTALPLATKLGPLVAIGDMNGAVTLFRANGTEAFRLSDSSVQPAVKHLARAGHSIAVADGSARIRMLSLRELIRSAPPSWICECSTNVTSIVPDFTSSSVIYAGLVNSAIMAFDTRAEGLMPGELYCASMSSLDIGAGDEESSAIRSMSTTQGYLVAAVSGRAAVILNTTNVEQHGLRQVLNFGLDGKDWDHDDNTSFPHLLVAAGGQPVHITRGSTPLITATNAMIMWHEASLPFDSPLPMDLTWVRIPLMVVVFLSFVFYELKRRRRRKHGAPIPGSEEEIWEAKLREIQQQRFIRQALAGQGYAEGDDDATAWEVH